MRRRELLLWPLSVIAAAAGVLLILQLNPFGLLAPCPLRVWTGIPCPACGGTLAMRQLLNMHIGSAFATNPLVAIVTLAAALSALGALIALPWADRLPARLRPPRRLLLLLLFGLLLANWIYLLARYS